jgi:Holliday junction resolvase RusA-like endonuclease
MRKLKFEVLGKPKGKARARAGKFGHYTPEEQVNYECHVKDSFLRKYPDSEPITGVVILKITAIFQVPKSYGLKKRKDLFENSTFHVKKPDLDNIIKSIKDGLNGIAWIDDSQVAMIDNTKKIYGLQNKVIVEIWEV